MNKVQAEGFFPEHRAATADTSAAVRRGFLELIEHHAGKYGDAVHGKYAPVGPWRNSRLPWTWTSSPWQGLLLLRLAPWMPSPVCLALCFSDASWSPSPALSAPGCLTCSAHPPRPPLEAYHSGAPGAWLWCFPAHCTCRPLCSSALSLWLAAHFLPLFWCPVPPCLVAMSCVSLQLSSRRWPRLRTPSCSASPGSWAPLALVGLQPPPPLARLQPPQPPQRPRRRPRPATRLQALLRAAATTSASSRARSRSRSPAPLPKRAPRRSSSTASGLRGSVALAESGLVTGLAIKSCPPVPPAQLRLSRVSRALRAASVAPPPPGDAPVPSARSAPASEAPRAAEAASDSDDDWDALLDAHGLALPPGGAAAAVAQPADAAGASRRARDKRRRRLRKAAKRSMWREI